MVRRASALGVAILLVALTGCSQVAAQLQHETVSTDRAGHGVASGNLVTPRWGVVDGMLSVVVRNTTGQTLRYAEGVVRALDEDGRVLPTTDDAAQGACCTVVDLPPGGEYGFYADLVSPDERPSSVEVQFRNVSWAPADAAGTGTVHARPVRLESAPGGAVVVADVRVGGARVDVLGAQAFLEGPDGTFLAVVSGRWTCFEPGTRRIRMQLFHPVPAGTTVAKVLVDPVPDDPSQADPHCGWRRAGRGR